MNEISDKAFFSGIKREKNNKSKFIFQSSCDDSCDDKVGKEKKQRPQCVVAFSLAEPKSLLAYELPWDIQ